MGDFNFTKKPPTTDHQEVAGSEGPPANPGGWGARELDSRLERKRSSALGGPKAASGCAIRLALRE
eukprot:5963048-Alexandrium_andersonii.AAC.1